MMNTKPPTMDQLSKEESRLVRHVPWLITLFGALWTLESLFTWRTDSLAESVLSLLASAGATALGLIAWRTRSAVAVLLVLPIFLTWSATEMWSYGQRLLSEGWRWRPAIDLLLEVVFAYIITWMLWDTSRALRKVSDERR